MIGMDTISYSWREYTSDTFRLRVKQFIKAKIILKDNPGLLRSNLETVGNPSTKMLVDGWHIGLDDIDKLSLWTERIND